MLDIKVIKNPTHYVQGRSIEPIDVIEDWSMCHHLACTVKYIARAGRKNNLIEDRKKAEWCLERELTRFQRKSNKCHPSFGECRSIPIRSVLADWNLSTNLEHTLIFISTAKDHVDSDIELTKALKFLRREIVIQKSIR